MIEAKYTINHAIDGWPVCKDGEAIPNNKAMLAELHQLQARVKGLEAEKAKLVEALEEGLRAIGDHHAPGDCYAIGPMTGDPFRDLVPCPACSFIAMCDDHLAAHRSRGGEQ